MQVDPAIAALRDDPEPQRRAQERLERAHAAWRANQRLAAWEAELALFGNGAAVERLPRLAGLFAQDRGPTELIDEFMQVTCAVLREFPLSQLGLRHHLDDRIATLVLARQGGATLTLQALDGRALAGLPVPETVIFTPSESIERVLAGAGRANLVTAAAAAADRLSFTIQNLDLGNGVVLRRDGSRQALQFQGFAGSLLLLKLQRRQPGYEPSREYRLADGKLVGQAAGNPRDSRIELAAALLGRMERVDAAPVLAAIAEDRGGAGQRWQVLRQCLALDSRTGFGALSRIAADAADPLAMAAGALRAQLLEAWPELGEVAACPVS